MELAGSKVARLCRLVSSCLSHLPSANIPHRNTFTVAKAKRKDFSVDGFDIFFLFFLYPKVGMSCLEFSRNSPLRFDSNDRIGRTISRIYFIFTISHFIIIFLTISTFGTITGVFRFHLKRALLHWIRKIDTVKSNRIYGFKFRDIFYAMLKKGGNRNNAWLKNQSRSRIIAIPLI